MLFLVFPDRLLYVLRKAYTTKDAIKPHKSVPTQRTSITSNSPEINFCITALFFTYAPNVRFNAGRMTRCIASWLAGIAPAERLCVDEPMVGGRGFRVP